VPILFENLKKGEFGLNDLNVLNSLNKENVATIPQNEVVRSTETNKED